MGAETKLAKSFSEDLQALATCNYTQYEAANGHVYGISVYGTNVANNGFIYLQFDIPEDSVIKISELTLKIQDGATTEGELYVYEDPTHTTGTTSLTPRNYNRTLANPDNSSVYVFSDPTGISGGTLIFFDYISADKAGGGVSLNLPTTLKGGSTYILAFKNISGAAATMLARAMWIEK